MLLHLNKALAGTVASVALSAGNVVAVAQPSASVSYPSSNTSTNEADPLPTRLILLGTAGGPIIRVDRSEAANLVIANGVPFLIDAGPGTQRQLKRAGYRPVDLAAIFVTHHHLDHNGDIATLIGKNWVERRKQAMPILGPYGTVDLVNAALDYFKASERIFSHGSRVSGLTAAEMVVPQDISKPGVVYEDGNVRVTAIFNSHYQTFDSGLDRAISFRFDTSDRSIVFTGDTGPSEALVALAKDADVLVSEVIDVDSTLPASFADVGRPFDVSSPLADHMREEHLSPAEVGKLAKAANVKMVVLTHLAPGLDTESVMTLYSEGVRAEYDGPVIVGMDLLEL